MVDPAGIEPVTDGGLERGRSPLDRWLAMAGLTIDQTAQAMGVSDRTVDRLWLYARAWLHRAMRSFEES